MTDVLAVLILGVPNKLALSCLHTFTEVASGGNPHKCGPGSVAPCGICCSVEHGTDF